MHQWQKFGENLSIDTEDIVETWKSGMHSVMLWPWPLTFWPQNLISSSLSRDAPMTKVWRKSVNRYWRYRGNIKLPRESRTHARTDGRMHGRTTRKHIASAAAIASAGAYWRRRLKNTSLVIVQLFSTTKRFLFLTANLCKISRTCVTGKADSFPGNA